MERFRKVTKREPCPVCGHADWCVVSNDGGTAICMRTESDRPNPNGGWIHVLKRIPPPERRVCVPPPVRRRLFDAERAMAGFRAEFEEPGDGRDVFDSAIEIGKELGLAGAVVDRLVVGRSKFYNAWAFPMRDGLGKVVGIRLRGYGTSDKWSVAGSRDGLFYDPSLVAETSVSGGLRGREIVICEGASDCAAAYSIGLPCVGRSSCMTGADELAVLCKRLMVSRVTIVADNDSYKPRVVRSPSGAPMRAMWHPGTDGAAALARRLGRPFRIVVPPKKDLREWVRQGCTRETFYKVADMKKWQIVRDETKAPL